MKRLFRATALSIVLAAACSDHPAPIVDPVLEPAANHVPGEPPTVHSVGVLVSGAIATVVWHVDPFNMGVGYTVEVSAGTSCSGINLVPGGASLAGSPWTQPFHLYVAVGPLGAGEYCARVKSNGVFSPPSFQAFITVRFAIGTANSPPEAGFDAPAGAEEGESVEFAGTAEDPDGDPLTLHWEIDGVPASADLSFAHVFEDDGRYEVTLTVADGKGGIATATRSIDVSNVAPSMLSAAATGAIAIPAGTPLEVAGEFTDPGALDTHSLELDCNDGGTAIPGTDLMAVRPRYAGTCVWPAAGTYHPRTTITDDDGGADSRLSTTVVVYVPGAGHVTGGGWIDSPAGACQLTPACAAASGRATIGFTSRYLRNAAGPVGSVTFQLGGAALAFNATSQLWLSVTGALARVGGSGRINGKGEYDFLLTAVDGGIGGAADGFRLWIRDRRSGLVVYDSRPGTDLLADDVDALADGSIVIHAGN